MKIAPYLTDLTDANWAALQFLLPATKRRGHPRTALRRVVNGFFYLLTAGCQWRLLPHRLPVLSDRDLIRRSRTHRRGRRIFLYAPNRHWERGQPAPANAVSWHGTSGAGGDMKTLFCLGRNGVQLLVVKRGKRYRERQVQFTDLQAALSWCRTRGVSFIWTPSGVAVAARK